MIIRHIDIPLRAKGRTLVVQESDTALDDNDAVVSIKLYDRYDTVLQIMQLTVEAADALRRGLVALDVHKEIGDIKAIPTKFRRTNPHKHKQGRSK